MGGPKIEASDIYNYLFEKLAKIINDLYLLLLILSLFASCTSCIEAIYNTENTILGDNQWYLNYEYMISDDNQCY